MRRAPWKPADPRPPVGPGAVITGLVPSSRDPTKVWVRVDRRAVASLDVRVVEELGLAVGQGWSEDLAEAVRRAKAEEGGRAYALRALGARAMSRAGLVRRLERRGLGPESAARVAQSIERMGLLDDAAYARAFVRSQLERKAAGRTLLMGKLRQKGIDRDTARAAVDEALAERELPDDAYALAARRLRTMPRTLEPIAVKRRLYGYLARRGFDPEACARAVDRAMREGDVGQARPG